MRDSKLQSLIQSRRASARPLIVISCVVPEGMYLYECGDRVSAVDSLKIKILNTSDLKSPLKVKK